MARLIITSKHAVRADITGLGDYFDSIGSAVSEVQRVLADHNMEAILTGCTGDEGYTSFVIRPLPAGDVICSCCAEKIACASYENCVAFSWYKIRDGRWEIIVYIS